MVQLVASFARPGPSFEALCLRQRAPQDEAGRRRPPTLRAGLAVTLTREWRRKPLKSLKTDSGMASRSIRRMPMTYRAEAAPSGTDQLPVGVADRCAAT